MGVMRQHTRREVTAVDKKSWRLWQSLGKTGEHRHCPYYGRVWARKKYPEPVLGGQVRKQGPKTGAEGWELKSEEVKQRPRSSA